MRNEDRDFVGWAFNIAIVGLTLAALKSSDAVAYLSCAILISVINGIRPGKTLSTARLRFVDSRWTVRGVLGATPRGIGLTIPNRSDDYNGAVFNSLWHAPAASFTFEGTQTVGGKFQEPFIGVRGIADAKPWSYAVEFNYASEPVIKVLERKGSYQDNTDHLISYSVTLGGKVTLNHRLIGKT